MTLPETRNYVYNNLFNIKQWSSNDIFVQVTLLISSRNFSETFLKASSCLLPCFPSKSEREIQSFGEVQR